MIDKQDALHWLDMQRDAINTEIAYAAPDDKRQYFGNLKIVNWIVDRVREMTAVEFFCKLMCADIPVVVVENPVGIMSGEYVAKWFPDLAEKYGMPYKVMQIVQPFQFGDRARKTTCLFGHGWESLNPTEIVDPGEILKGGFSVGAGANYARDENGKILAWNDPRTAKIRSKSFPGIAKAMAEQWGGDVRQEEHHE